MEKGMLLGNTPVPFGAPTPPTRMEVAKWSIPSIKLMVIVGYVGSANAILNANIHLDKMIQNF